MFVFACLCVFRICRVLDCVVRHCWQFWRLVGAVILDGLPSYERIMSFWVASQWETSTVGLNEVVWVS